MMINRNYGKELLNFVKKYDFSSDGIDYKYAIHFFDNYNIKVLESIPDYNYDIDDINYEDANIIEVSHEKKVEDVLNSFGIYTKHFDASSNIHSFLSKCVVLITNNKGGDLSPENLKDEIESSLNRFDDFIKKYKEKRFKLFIFIKTDNTQLRKTVKDSLEKDYNLIDEDIEYVQNFSESVDKRKNTIDIILEEFYNNTSFKMSNNIEEFSKLLEILLVKLDSDELKLSDSTYSSSLFNKNRLSDTTSTPLFSKEVCRLINSKVDIIVDKCNKVENDIKTKAPNLYGLFHPIIYISDKGLREKIPQELHTTYRNLIFDIYRKTKCSIYIEGSNYKFCSLYANDVFNTNKMYIEDVFNYIENDFIVLVDNSIHNDTNFYGFKNIRPCFSGFKVELNFENDMLFLDDSFIIEPVNSFENYSQSNIVSIKTLLNCVDDCKKFKINVFDKIYSKEDKTIPKYLTIKNVIVLKENNKYYLYYVNNYSIKFDLCRVTNSLGICSNISEIKPEKFLSLIPLDFFGNSRFILPEILKRLGFNPEKNKEIETYKLIDTHKSLIFSDLALYLASYPDISNDDIGDVKSGNLSDVNLKFLDVISYYPTTDKILLKNFNNEMIDIIRFDLNKYRKMLDCFGGFCKLLVNDFTIIGDEFNYE